MSTRSAEASIVIQARDKATGQFRKVAMESQRLGGAWRILTAVLRQLNISMIAMATVLPVIGAALASIVTVAATVSFLKWEQSARRARIQLQFLGFSASESKQQMDSLASTMGRANAMVMFQSASAMTDVAIAGQAMTAQIAPMADTFADLVGASPADVFSAFFDIFAKQDPSKFERLVAGTENITIPLEMITALEAGDFGPFLTWFNAITNKESLTQMEILAQNLADIGELTAPAAETISETTAAFANIFVSSLKTRLTALKDNVQLIFAGGLSGALIASAATPEMTGAFKILGTRMGAGLAAAAAAALIVDFGTTWATIVDEPKILVPIVMAALTLGRITGKFWVGAAVGVIGLQLGPGIAEVTKSLSTEKEIELLAGGLGFALGVVLKKNLMTKLALGATLAQAAKEVVEDETWGHRASEAAFIAVGTAMGFALTRNLTGALIGAALATAAYDAIPDGNMRIAFGALGGAAFGFMLAGLPGMLLFSLIGSAAMMMTDPEMQLAFTQMGKNIGVLIVNALIAMIKLGVASINTSIRAINWVSSQLGIPKIPEVSSPDYLPLPGRYKYPEPKTFIPDPFNLPGGGGEAPTGLDRWSRFRTPDFNRNTPTAIPIPIPIDPRRNPGSEFYRPTGTSSSGGVTVVQLTMDKRVMGEIIIDELGRVSEFQGGLNHGFAAGA